MYLSDRDLKWAIKHEQLIVEPEPQDALIGPTSIDLRLDHVDQAKVWDVDKFAKVQKTVGIQRPELAIGEFDYKAFAAEYLKKPPSDKPDCKELVVRKGDEIVIKPQGFLLWQTKEKVGSPEEGAQLICFIDGKSTRARTGILVHLTAPTIHAAWGSFNVTLEIANLGPFYLVLKEDDVIAQLTVATISSIPQKTMKQAGSVTTGQKDVSTAS